MLTKILTDELRQAVLRMTTEGTWTVVVHGEGIPLRMGSERHVQPQIRLSEGRWKIGSWRVRGGGKRTKSCPTGWDHPNWGLVDVHSRQTREEGQDRTGLNKIRLECFVERYRSTLTLDIRHSDPPSESIVRIAHSTGTRDPIRAIPSTTRTPRKRTIPASLR